VAGRGLSEAEPDSESPEDSLSPGDRLAAALLGGLLLLLRLLPAERAVALGGTAGRWYARLSAPRTRTARINLRIAFPHWSEERRRRVLERSLENLGRCIVEFTQFASLDEAALRERVTISGLEHLDEARKASRSGGIVVLTGHFGSWELLAASMSAWGFPVVAVRRLRDNRALEAVASRLRAAGGTRMLARGSAARAALRALRAGDYLAMPYDQNCKREEGVFVQFFGRLACTRDGPPRMATRTGAPVLPVFLYRQPDGFHHEARILPPLELAPEEGDREARQAAIVENAQRMTRVMEDVVREAPDHWIWIHARWRTQPVGEARPY
jgi:KDO2-lipid IV(A) lauroyltransferase